MKLIKYKGVQVKKPDNISLKYVKKIIDVLGKDYCFDVNQVVNFLSKNKITYHEPEQPTNPGQPN